MESTREAARYAVKSISRLFVLATILFFTACSESPLVTFGLSEKKASELQIKAGREFIDLLGSEQFEQAQARLTDHLQQYMTPDDISRIWMTSVNEKGSFVEAKLEHSYIIEIYGPNSAIFMYKCRFGEEETGVFVDVLADGSIADVSAENVSTDWRPEESYLFHLPEDSWNSFD